MPSIRRTGASAGATSTKGSGGKSYFWCLFSFLLGVAVTRMLYQGNDIAATTRNAPTEVPTKTSPATGTDGGGDAVNVGGSTKTQMITTKDFQEIGLKAGTDKVVGPARLPDCLKTGQCTRPECEREECRPWGHWYHTLYEQWISKYALPTTEPFQFLEIGFYQGRGFETYSQFFSEAPKAELHSMEISCIEGGTGPDGKWPNTAKESPRYQELLGADRLHCGDASNLTILNDVWQNKMHRPDAPPLRIVIDDASHLSSHMVTSFFFWFPRIEPGGLLIVEDIQPIHEANRFRTQFLPQIMSDLHYCGDRTQAKDEACFPQIWPLLQSIHCEMHICVFERNSAPAKPDLPLEESKVPDNALDLTKCYSFAHSFGA